MAILSVVLFVKSTMHSKIAVALSWELTSPEGYQVTDSEVNVDGKFVGLCLDEADADNNPARIAAWVELVK